MFDMVCCIVLLSLLFCCLCLHDYMVIACVVFTLCYDVLFVRCVVLFVGVCLRWMFDVIVLVLFRVGC